MAARRSPASSDKRNCSSPMRMASVSGHLSSAAATNRPNGPKREDVETLARHSSAYNVFVDRKLVEVDGTILIWGAAGGAAHGAACWDGVRCRLPCGVAGFYPCGGGPQE